MNRYAECTIAWIVFVVSVLAFTTWLCWRSNEWPIVRSYHSQLVCGNCGDIVYDGKMDVRSNGFVGPADPIPKHTCPELDFRCAKKLSRELIVAVCEARWFTEYKQLIVGYQPGEPLPSSFWRKNGFELIRTDQANNFHLIKSTNPQKGFSTRALLKLANTPSVLHVEPDYEVHLP